MTSFVNSALTNHQGAERAEQALQTLRHIGAALVSFPLQVLSALPEGWNNYITYLEQRESDEELWALAQRDGRVMNELMAASYRKSPR